ncbi:ABC transporter ATP-binding protein [Pendulispora albinea]|uniref:ABC transporter ATP-binding protein n=1 Tax=Pendulispora albinea TaxID=2741071 RepID=A0ABZ2LUY0_9BACT
MSPETSEPNADPVASPAAAPPAPSEVSEDAQPSPKPAKKKKVTEAAVRMKHVTKRFGAKLAVDDLSLEIRAGRVYGLIGPNGAGKTTTFSMLAGYLQPTNGEIEVLGYDPHHVSELKSRVGVLPQDAILPPLDKVGEFLVHMARLQGTSRDRAESMARAVLEEVEGRDWWNQRCSSLSHGMAKRVQLAQALLGDPEVVLLDEPTGGLDPRSAYEVRQLIKARKGRCTLIVSSHNLQELEEICDGAAILDRGKLIASGTIAQLTGASEEVHIKLGRAPRGMAASAYNATSAEGVVSRGIQRVRDLPIVKRADYDDEKNELVVYFERGPELDAEAVIGHVLWALLQEQVRISGVSKGRGLERRVMDLTEDEG